MEAEMADIIEGIPNRKLERLKKHLELVEKKTGMPLRKTPREGLSICPIFNFAPGKDGKGYFFLGATLEGRLGYIKDRERRLFLSCHRDKLYEIYEVEDSIWWENRSDKLKRQVTKYIQDWIKNR
jgi:hypothetical protein